MLVDCEQLENYLSGELDEREANTFAMHLAVCETCRETIAQQEWLDDLLHVGAVAEVAPVEVATRVDRAIEQKQLQQRFTYGFALAASLLLAFVLWPTGKAQQAEQSASTVEPLIAKATPVEKKPVATFIGGEDMIVIHHESEYDNVTIVEIYPTITATRHWQNEAEDNSTPTPQQTFGDPS